MTIAPIINRNKHIEYYVLDSDFSEYVMEMGIQTREELWGMLEDYLKEECHEL
jgi:hypothetical protein